MRPDEQNRANGPRVEASGAERRRHERQNRRLVVTFTLEGVEHEAWTVDLSRGGALFQAPETPSVGTGLLFNLSDRQNPDMSLFLKGRVVRLATGPNGEKLFGVEFGDVLARDPKRLRTFLDRVLGVDSGLIRVVEGEGGMDKAYAFSFEPLHREGEERLRALQSSLFRTVEEMEEADAILSNFGKMPVESRLAERASSAGSDVLVRPVEAGQPPAPHPQDVDEATSEDLMIPLPVQGKMPSLFSRLARALGLGKERSKGETLIQTQQLPTVVARNVDLPVVFRSGTTRYQGVAVRLYCAGLKISTDQDVPPLYANLSILIPLAGAKRINQIELNGDVTRVRPHKDDSATGGIFEVRLSMRTDKVHLELYRALLERFVSRQSGGR